MQGDDAVQKPPDGIAVLSQIDRWGKFAPFNAVLEDSLDDVDGHIGHFYDVMVDVIGKIHVVGVEHVRDENTEEFRIVEEKIDVDGGEFMQDGGGRVPVVEKILDLPIELFDIVEKDLGVDFFLAVVIKIDGTLAEFRLFGDAFDGYGFEPLFKKKPARGRAG